jgi:hypothetical protein
MASEESGGFCEQCNQPRLFRREVPNHILHILIAIFTGGLWVPIWILMAVFSSAPRRCTTCGCQPPPAWELRRRERFARKRKRAEAERIAEQEREADPILALARGYLRQGDETTARGYLTRLVADFPKTSAAEQARGLLARLGDDVVSKAPTKR